MPHISNDKTPDLTRFAGLEAGRKQSGENGDKISDPDGSVSKSSEESGPGKPLPPRRKKTLREVFADLESPEKLTLLKALERLMGKR